MPPPAVLRARVVAPLSQPPIHDGAVSIFGNHIAAVGRSRDLCRSSHASVHDLGEVILLPGLVNAHCHLDYTHMAGQFPPPRLFTDWLKLITSTKAGWTLADYAASWAAGARMLFRTGTTTVADIEAVPALLPRVWNATPLRVFSFLELIGITNRRLPQAIVQEALDKIRAVRGKRGRLGLSPHAPYSTLPELLRLSAAAARRYRLPVTTHVAESVLEFQMFSRGEGEMFDWLKRSGRDMSDCGLGSPVQHLERCGVLGAGLLAAHVNCIGQRDAALLGRRKVSVVHCPRSHFYFRHEPFPLHRLLGARVNICLGTDSLATVYRSRREIAELNLFAEMQTLAQRETSLSPKAILRMATMNGAAALGLGGRIGQLSRNAFADLIAIPFAGRPARVYEAILGHAGPVSASMIDGRWAVTPGR